MMRRWSWILLLATACPSWSQPLGVDLAAVAKPPKERVKEEAPAPSGPMRDAVASTISAEAAESYNAFHMLASPVLAPQQVPKPKEAPAQPRPAAKPSKSYSSQRGKGSKPQAR